MRPRLPGRRGATVLLVVSLLVAVAGICWWTLLGPAAPTVDAGIVPAAFASRPRRVGTPATPAARTAPPATIAVPSRRRRSGALVAPARVPPTTDATASAVPPARRTPTSRAAQRGQGVDLPRHLAIASIGVSAPVVPIGDPDGVLTPPSDITEVGWWKNGPSPGAPTGGTSVLVGHVDGRNAAGTPIEGALFSLDRVPIGGTAEVRMSNGRVLDYRLEARRIYRKAALPVRHLFVSTGAARLVIVTCGGPFDAVTRHYLDNVVAYFTPVRSARTTRSGFSG